MTNSSKPKALRLGVLVIRRELTQYLTTWSGYVITAGMLLSLGLGFNVYAVGPQPSFSAEILERYFYLASGITLVGGTLLAMRLIAEEHTQGTYPLLATSSLSEGQIVLAKYFAAMVPIALFLALSLYMPLWVLLKGRVSIGHVAAGYLGLMLIGSAGVAIGLVGSALAKSQMIAAIISLLICGLGVSLWRTARLVPGHLGEIMAHMTLHGRHFTPFQDGIISPANVVYYVSVTAFFLVVARNLLERRRWRP